MFVSNFAEVTASSAICKVPTPSVAISLDVITFSATIVAVTAFAEITPDDTFVIAML
jgi:hypothetical protein